MIKESTQSTKNVTSVHLGLSVNGKIKGLPVKSLTGDLTTTPQTAAQGNASIVFGGSDIDAPFVVIDGILYGALTPGQWDSFGKASDLYDPSTILKPDVGLANVLTNLSNPKAESRETRRRTVHHQDHRNGLGGCRERHHAATEGDAAAALDGVDRREWRPPACPDHAGAEPR